MGEVSNMGPLSIIASLLGVLDAALRTTNALVEQVRMRDQERVFR